MCRGGGPDSPRARDQAPQRRRAVRCRARGVGGVRGVGLARRRGAVAVGPSHRPAPGRHRALGGVRRTPRATASPTRRCSSSSSGCSWPGQRCSRPPTGRCGAGRWASSPRWSSCSTGCCEAVADLPRYYDRRGLLTEPRRSPGGHREHGPEVHTVLRVARGPARLGFTLDEISELIAVGSHRPPRPGLRDGRHESGRGRGADRRPAAGPGTLTDLVAPGAATWPGQGRRRVPRLPRGCLHHRTDRQRQRRAVHELSEEPP